MKTIDYSSLPGYMQGGMRRYMELGIAPGHFLTAVLKNDLMEAARRADETNLHALGTYAIFLHSQAPCGSYGSPENVKSWINQRQAERYDAAE